MAVDDAYSTTLETPLDVAAPGVLSNDTDANGDSPTATLVSSTSHGTLALNPDGSFSYVPDDGYTGPDSFTYTASDGTDSSNPATVNLTVNAAAEHGQHVDHPAGLVHHEHGTPRIGKHFGPGHAHHRP